MKLTQKRAAAVCRVRGDENRVRILKRTEQKLRSQEGAAILMALLVFLVCVCIGSVVLSAGTAAAGRFSKTAESDRRYYAVESAARLLKGVFDGKTVTISRTKTDTRVKKYRLITTDNTTSRDSGTPDNNASKQEYAVSVDIAGEETDDDSVKMARFVSLRLFDGNLEQVPSGEKQYEMPMTPELNVTDTVTIKDADYSAFPEYSASYSLKLDSGKRAELIFNIKAENYGVKVKFHADIHEETATRSAPETSVVDGANETVTQVTEETKTMMITWVYDGIEVS